MSNIFRYSLDIRTIVKGVRFMLTTNSIFEIVKNTSFENLCCIKTQVVPLTLLKSKTLYKMDNTSKIPPTSAKEIL